MVVSTRGKRRTYRWLSEGVHRTQQTENCDESEKIKRARDFLANIRNGFSFFIRRTTTVVDLWPGLVPGEKQSDTHEQDTTKEKDGLVAGKSVIRLGNVSKPTISVYVPDASKNTGTAVLVCPGGGYHILAMDLEGTEYVNG